MIRLLAILAIGLCAACLRGANADLILDFESGSVGDVINEAYFNANQKGATANKWTWNYQSRPVGHTKVDASNHTRLSTITVDGVDYTGAGTRSLKFDHAEAITDALTPIYDGLAGSPPTNINVITLSGVIRFNATMGAETAFNMDPIKIGGSPYLVMQISYGNGGGTAGKVHIETQDVAGTLKSSEISVDAGVWYAWTLYYNSVTGRMSLLMMDAATGAYVGFSSHKSNVTGGTPIGYVTIQDYLNFGGGYTLHDNISFNWTSPAFPVETIPTIPPPANLRSDQTASGKVRLFWSSPAETFLFERWTSAGDWVTLHSNLERLYGNQIYFDETVADGVTYQYRVSANVGDLQSAPTVSSMVAVDNTPNGTESVYVTQASGGSSVSINEGSVLSQRIKNTLGTSLWISEVALDSEFFSRGETEYLYLTENSDGSGTIYGQSSGTAISGNGPIVFTFFAGCPVPTTGCYLYYAPTWVRTQIKFTASDAYLPGEGYNGNYNNTGLIFGGTADLKFTIKHRPPPEGGSPGNLIADVVNVGTLVLPSP